MAYAHDRKGYEQLGRAGWKIVGKRKKPPHNVFYVPLLPEVLQLFEQYPEGPYEYCLNTINQHTPKFEQLLGVGWRITAKTARKTFGNMMLNRGYRIADVSKMLGHSTIAMTERHYVRVGETHIDCAMLRVEGVPSAAQAIVYLEAA
jgi:integrase